MTLDEAWRAVKWGLTGGACVTVVVAAAVIGNVQGFKQGMNESNEFWKAHLDEDGCIVAPKTYST